MYSTEFVAEYLLHRHYSIIKQWKCKRWIEGNIPSVEHLEDIMKKLISLKPQLLEAINKQKIEIILNSLSDDLEGAISILEELFYTLDDTIDREPNIFGTICCELDTFEECICRLNIIKDNSCDDDNLILMANNCLWNFEEAKWSIGMVMAKIFKLNKIVNVLYCKTDKYINGLINHPIIIKK